METPSPLLEKAGCIPLANPWKHPSTLSFTCDSNGADLFSVAIWWTHKKVEQRSGHLWINCDAKNYPITSFLGLSGIVHECNNQLEKAFLAESKFASLTESVGDIRLWKSP
jgi:hypothetical protein